MTHCAMFRYQRRTSSSSAGWGYQAGSTGTGGQVWAGEEPPAPAPPQPSAAGAGGVSRQREPRRTGSAGWCPGRWQQLQAAPPLLASEGSAGMLGAGHAATGHGLHVQRSTSNFLHGVWCRSVLQGLLPSWMQREAGAGPLQSWPPVPLRPRELGSQSRPLP